MIEIKIIKCKNESYFYVDMVGDVLKVKKTKKGYQYLCENKTYGYISFEDAIEL